MWNPSNWAYKRLFYAALAALLAFTTLAFIPGGISAADAATNHEFEYVIVFQNGQTRSGITSEGTGNTIQVPNTGGASVDTPDAFMLVHASCSDNFNLDKDPSDPSYGYSDAGSQPEQGVDTAWRIADYGFRRTGTNGGRCGNQDLFDANISIDKKTNDADHLGSVPTGTALTWTYEVTNTGNTALTNVTVTDNRLPDTDITCPQDTLAVGESMTCSATGTATAGSYTNIGTADSDETPPVTDNSSYFGETPGILLDKVGQWNDESGDGFAQPGETISYTFAVTNDGNVTLFDITLDDLVGGVTVSGGPISSLAPGESDLTTFTASYALTQDDIDAGTFYNQAQACGFGSDESKVCDEDDHEEPLPQSPSIGIVKDVDPTTIVGDQASEVTWTITVTNTGNVTLHDVAVTDALVAACDLTIGDLPIGGSSTHSCKSTHTPDVETWSFTNVAIADGFGPLGTAVTASDDATVLPVFVAASATIGDTVWSDENANGVQDNGEKGIAGARVKLTLPDGTTAEATTNANGLYLFSGLEAGQYTAELITNSIPAPADGENRLTTAGSFTIQLTDGQSYLDADFGIVATLPKTGIDSDQIAIVALAMLLVGGLALLATRDRKTGAEADGFAS